MPDGKLYGVSNIGGTYTDFYINDITNMSWVTVGNTFWNGRQGYMINPVDIDINGFNEWVDDYGPAAFKNDPDNSGVFYIALSNVQGRAVRLRNAEELQGDGLTVATPNPMYVEGNYNTVDKKPSSLYSDSFTMLSVAWDDKKNDKNNTGKARDTILNAAIVTGHVPSTPGLYSGGLENLIRYLENWGAQTFTMSGALISIWFSRQETVNYDELGPADTYYTPPYRDWGYENLFSNPGTLPPGTPGIWLFELKNWERVH
jgi:hypothetical protein